MNISLPPSTDISQIRAYFLSANAPPKGRNWAELEERGVRRADRPDREVDRPEADPQGHPAAHEIIVDEAPWVFIVHDRNPRAMTKKVKGFTSAQSWFQDFTRVDME